jgi:hypothetical protein
MHPHPVFVTHFNAPCLGQHICKNNIGAFKKSSRSEIKQALNQRLIESARQGRIVNHKGFTGRLTAQGTGTL